MNICIYIYIYINKYHHIVEWGIHQDSCFSTRHVGRMSLDIDHQTVWNPAFWRYGPWRFADGGTQNRWFFLGKIRLKYGWYEMGYPPFHIDLGFLGGDSIIANLQEYSSSVPRFCLKSRGNSLTFTSVLDMHLSLGLQLRSQKWVEFCFVWSRKSGIYFHFSHETTWVIG